MENHENTGISTSVKKTYLILLIRLTTTNDFMYTAKNVVTKTTQHSIQLNIANTHDI